MAFGISQSVRSREVQVCTPELFHQATKSSRVKDVCAQIEDALERKRRGEIGQEDYDTMNDGRARSFTHTSYSSSPSCCDIHF